jgi:ribonuclease R
MATVIEPLYGAFAALRAARERREPLALELPERRVLLGADGRIRAVVPRPHYDSHRLIEEFMIAANVCAAETLEEARQPCMYRVHDEPAHEKVEALREFLDSLGLRFAKGQVLKPALFNRVLRHVEGTPQAHLVNQVVLRSQSQAAYSPDNIGHFGLALRRYAHFTSPIRRYADLLVHRALIGGLRLGDGGLSGEEAGAFAAIADHISMTERRAMTAERDALDRFTAAYMADRVGATFAGRIDGVTRFGLFVELAESGADGLIPISALGDDFYIHDERLHALVGRRTGRTFRLGDEIEVRLAEAELVTGSLRLELVSAGGERRARRGRTPPARRAERRSERRRRP